MCWLIATVSICAASNSVNAIPNITFTDSWKDSGAFDPVNGYYIETTGSTSFVMSVPLDGFDVTQVNEGTILYIGINNLGIFYDYLGNAERYTNGGRFAKFAWFHPQLLEQVGWVTISWTATNITVTGSATSDALVEEANYVSNSDGVPADNSKRINTVYDVNLQFGYFSYDNPNVPVVGINYETEWRPRNGSGPYPAERGTITGTGDFIPPQISIASPAANTRFYDTNLVVHLKGNVSDNVSVASVAVYINGNFDVYSDIDQHDELPAKSLTWTSSVDLSEFGQIGPNDIIVVASDIAGNLASITRTFLWVETNSSVMTVNPSGGGTIRGIRNGQVLDEGFSYPVTATPTNNKWAFSEWTDGEGNVLSTTPSFDYVDTDGTLKAVFVSNPFPEIGGAYSALFFYTNSLVFTNLESFNVTPINTYAQASNSGCIKLNVTPTGGYSGKIYLAISNEPFLIAGQMAVAPDGSVATAEQLIKVGNLENLDVQLQLNADTYLSDPGAGTITGYVTSTTEPAGIYQPEIYLLWGAPIQGYRNADNTFILPGLYNLVIAPGSSDPSQGPGGYSYGTANVSKEGAVSLVLHLSDGTSPAISFSSSVAKDGACPIYAPLYRGLGVILGWMQFTSSPSSSLQPQAINWTKLPVENNYLSNWFAATPSVSGALYLPPKAATNILGWTDGTFTVDGGYSGLSLPDETDASVTYNPVNNVFTDTSKVSVTLTESIGALTGTFYPAGSKSALTYHGVVVEGSGYGFYSGTNHETGPITITGEVPVGGGGIVPPPPPLSSPGGGSAP